MSEVEVNGPRPRRHVVTDAEGVTTVHENGQSTNFSMDNLPDESIAFLTKQGFHWFLLYGANTPSAAYTKLLHADLARSKGGRKPNSNGATKTLKLGKTRQKVYDLLIATGADHTVALQKASELDLRA